jgi:hypothetical protein
MVELDNLLILSVKPGATQSTWEATKKKLPAYKHVPLETKKKGKGKGKK